MTRAIGCLITFPFVFPINLRVEISAVFVNKLSSLEETWLWPNCQGEKFNSKFTYDWSDTASAESCNWQSDPANRPWLWKISCHPRVKSFLWLLAHRAIPTNTFWIIEAFMFLSAVPSVTGMWKLSNIFLLLSRNTPLWPHLNSMPHGNSNLLEWLQKFTKC